MLADFEEEQVRRGHYTLIFPLAKNIDTYRPYLSQQRRSNIVLWSYIKQGCPINQLTKCIEESKSITFQSN